MKSDASADPRLSPAECRERGLTYGGAMNAVICRRINDGPVERVPRKLGAVAVMVRSARCYTAGLSPEELVRRHEEPSGLGGYFIVNGKERLLRMLQIPRRNHPLAVTRAAFSKRGKAYSNKGVMMRCVRPDQSGVTVTLHYLLDGSAMLRFSVKKQEFFIPASLALRCARAVAPALHVFVDSCPRETTLGS
jgi:DNA-directed RNA polymerase I subunit RPA2